MPDPLAAALRALRAATVPDVDPLPAPRSHPSPTPRAAPPPAGAVPAIRAITDALDVAASLRAANEQAGLGAFVTLFDDAVATLAAPGPLHGVPVAIKDVIDVRGQLVGNGTAGFAHRVAASDATVWARLAAAGAVLVGRTRLHELAWGVRTPGCENPRVPGHGVGGSSGGSAAAVAAGIVPVALGTDTGGSIRIPAALCGVAGLRPTFGAISNEGVTPLAPSLDTVGPIARTAAECLTVHAVLGGAVASVPDGPLRVGRVDALWRGRLGAGVEVVVEASIAALRERGVEMVEIDLPLAEACARAVCFVVMLYESAAIWAPELDRDPSGLSPQTAGLLRLGRSVPAADYDLARRVGAAVRAEVDAALAGRRLAAILLPSVAVGAAPIDADRVAVGERNEGIDAAYARFTALASVTGHPALSVPAGVDSRGRPIGVQLIGARHQEAVLCRLATAIESAR